jgi:hypothetical protein
LITLVSLPLILGIAGCGKGSLSAGSVSTGSNVASIVVDAGPSGEGYVNGAFVTVTVCVPGSTTDCNAIDHVLVDTGSEGLRLVSSAGGGELNLSLPQETDISGRPLSECATFVANVTYGSVRLANIQISGETASNVPIQVIGDTSPVPANCSDSSPVQDTVATLGANGILGVGVFPEDCGGGCLESTSGNPAIYYSCSASGCASTVLTSLAQQVTNPVVLFPIDNNGVVVELPAISASGQTTVDGSLVFGINTQSNNQLGDATVFSLDPSTGNFVTIFKSVAVSGCGFRGSSGLAACGFVDSGSNGFFFSDPALTVCSHDTGFYCSNQTFSTSAVQNQGATGGPSEGVSFNVVSAEALFECSDCAAFNDLAGVGASTWDWGLPFFYGRNVYSSIEGQTVSGESVSPFVAY